MKNNADFSERLQNLIDYYKITPNEFGKKLGYKRTQTIYDLLNNKCKPSYDFVKKIIISEFSERFSTDWLITGEGPMLRNHGIINSGNGQQVVANHNNGTINADNRQYYSDSPDVLRAQIDTLNERIKEKDAQIKEKDAQINKLIELLGKKYESGQ